MSAPDGGRRYHRSAHRIAAAVLLLPLIGTVPITAHAAGHPVSDSTRSPIPVGGLTYEHGAQLDRVEGGKHFVPEDHPVPVARAVGGVLDESAV